MERGSGIAPREREVVVEGVRSPVLEVGPEGAPEAVVFIHGNPGSSRDWERLLAEVAGFTRGIAPDMPGFGDADGPDDFEYTAASYARHLAGILDRLGIRRVHLVVHDFGGPWGLVWGVANPDAFASVTLINSGVTLGYRWHYLARIWRTPLLGELFFATETRRVTGIALKHGNPRGLPDWYIDRVHAALSDRRTQRAVLRLYRASDHPGRSAEVLAAALRPLRLPALVVWGKHDPYLPMRLAHRQREVFPDAAVVILDDSGHWPFIDDPHAVTRAVVPFLRSQVGRSSGGR